MSTKKKIIKSGLLFSFDRYPCRWLDILYATDKKSVTDEWNFDSASTKIKKTAVVKTLMFLHGCVTLSLLLLRCWPGFFSSRTKHFDSALCNDDESGFGFFCILKPIELRIITLCSFNCPWGLDTLSSRAQRSGCGSSIFAKSVSPKNFAHLSVPGTRKSLENNEIIFSPGYYARAQLNSRGDFKR